MLNTRFKPQDRAYLQKALELAAAGCGCASSAPMFVAVAVEDDEIVGASYHFHHTDQYPHVLCQSA